MLITSGSDEKKTKRVGQEVGEHKWTATHRGREELFRGGEKPGSWVLGKGSTKSMQSYNPLKMELAGFTVSSTLVTGPPP